MKVAALPKRLFLEGPLAIGERSLPAPRAHYLKNVLRVRSNSPLQLFDGTGALAEASVVRLGREVAIAINSVRQLPAPPAPQVHLACAILKGKAMDQVLRKSTELGVSHLWPFFSEHTDVPRRAVSARTRSHWQSVIISAAEQCGQNFLPHLAPVSALAELTASAPVAQRLFTDASGAPWPKNLAPVDTMVFVGPEGGWSSQELTAAAAAGIPQVSLGPLVLRAETAPLVALTTLAVSWRFSADSGP